jgi:hypothetical protein
MLINVIVRASANVGRASHGCAGIVPSKSNLGCANRQWANRVVLPGVKAHSQSQLALGASRQDSPLNPIHRARHHHAGTRWHRSGAPIPASVRPPSPSRSTKATARAALDAAARPCRWARLASPLPPSGQRSPIAASSHPYVPDETTSSYSTEPTHKTP